MEPNEAIRTNFQPLSAMTLGHLIQMALIRVDAPHVVQEDVGFPQHLQSVFAMFYWNNSGTPKKSLLRETMRTEGDTDCPLYNQASQSARPADSDPGAKLCGPNWTEETG